MAQLATIASLAGTGLAVYGQVRQGQQQKATNRAQEENLRAQQTAQQEQAAVQAAANERARQEKLASTIASARARAAAGGIAPDEGSAAALTGGLRSDAAKEAAEDASLMSARLASGRRSLLASDGSFNSFLRAGQTLGGAVRNLLV
ncbi:hypothetical protein GXW78_12265 [Roseomonas terrae]|jgi:hypothetical protein|uniref:Uncharacterized protein n=1 Tax=Neoroseomonas terrae TaxID=424799 RepID=A0ABS5EHD1_9PROT|nr:hypothetical protein [Neoroseomonas terrae]MBR0650441.1 hypothetical protein [Neoroseomonas terrae]